MESQIIISLVHGGFILQTDDKTEVFSSQGKLMKAVRELVNANSLIAKSKDEADADKAE